VVVVVVVVVVLVGRVELGWARSRPLIVLLDR